MARKYPPIRAETYIRWGGQLVAVSELTPEQKDYVGTMLKIALLNEQHRGIAQFTADLPDPAELFPPGGPKSAQKQPEEERQIENRTV